MCTCKKPFTAVRLQKRLYNHLFFNPVHLFQTFKKSLSSLFSAASLRSKELYYVPGTSSKIRAVCARQSVNELVNLKFEICRQKKHFTKNNNNLRTNNITTVCSINATTHNTNYSSIHLILERDKKKQ